MKQQKSTNWKVQDALKELDMKLNYFQIAKNYVKEKCRDAAIIGGICLSVTGVFGVAIAPMAILAEVANKNKKIEAYETGLPRTEVYKQKYSDLVERVSDKTGVDERILLGLIAGGNTTYANGLRENGYAGIIPIKPEEAGVTADTLRTDDEQCLLSAAQVFKEIAEDQTNLEAVVSEFWYREKEKQAENAGGNWQFISAANNAYNDRTRAEQCSRAKEALMLHQNALEYEEMLANLPEEEQKFKELHGSLSGRTPLDRKITNPALLFYYKATIEAFERYNAGDKEFTWLDLLPVKLSATIYSSLAHMNGVELSSGSKTGE